MPAARVIKSADILEYSHFRLSPCLPCIAPDQFGLDGLEKCFDHGIVITVPFAAHGNLEPMFFQALLILM